MPSAFRHARLLLCAAFCLLPFTTGCVDVIHARNLGEQLDERFHTVLSPGGLRFIYPQADPEFRQQTSEAQANALFNAILSKLGTPTSSQQVSWRVNRTTAGTYLISVAKTDFSKQAHGTETITWEKGSDGNYRLAGYNINCNELITR